MLGPPDIPSYEEAISSTRPPRDADTAVGSSSEERTGLLQPETNYRRPMVSDARPSEDSLFSAQSRRSSEESLHREIEQFEVLDPPYEEEERRRASTSRRAYRHLQKRISSLASSVSSSLPRIRFPQLPRFSFSCQCFPFRKYLEKIMLYYRLFAVLFVIIIVYFLLAYDVFNFRGKAFLGQVFDPESVKSYALNQVDSGKIQNYLEYTSKFGHVAGTEGDLALTKFIEGEFVKASLDVVSKEDFLVYLNYPKPNRMGRSVTIVDDKDKKPFIATLREYRAEGNPIHPEVFNGYGKSGDVKGHLMFAGYGTPEEFRQLQADGVDFKNSVVLVMRKNGVETDLGAVVKAAEKAGAVGCLLGSGDWDPPAGQNVQGWEKMIRRGSVALMSQMLGDPLTPEIGSTPEAQRISRNDSPGVVNIPSLPISQEDAVVLVKKLNNLGTRVRDGLWTGNSSSPIIRLENQLVDLERKRVTNIFGQINGIEQHDRKVFIGNHRDSFCFGASSPNSGTAIMLELVRVFGEMMTYGWRPVRTIVFANWDAGEYNRIGSTEWAETHADDLRHNGLAYINLASAVAGRDFFARGSPALDTALKSALNRVIYPKSKSSLLSLYGPGKPLSALGAGGDYGAFQHFVGLSSIDVGFQGNPFPWLGSCKDTYEMMSSKDYDLGFDLHRAMAQVVALLILELADTSNMPFNMTNYANSASSWFADLERRIEDKYNTSTSSKKPQKPLDLTPLREAVELMRKNMREFDDKIKDWTGDSVSGALANLESSVAAAQRISHNSRMANFEHHLLEMEGVWGRKWFKHVLMAPSRDNGNEVTYFPSIRDAVDDDEWDVAREQVEKVAKKLTAATNKILH